MSDADRKDQAVTKTPLGFEQEVAPADPSLAGRRLFLKLALFGAAASVLPAAAFAAGTSSGVGLPYRTTFTLTGEPGVLSDGKGAESVYRVSGSGDLYIDSAGTVFLSNIKAVGNYESGTLNVGTISAVQAMASMAGRYDGTALDATATVLYSDGEVTQQPAALRIAGNVAKGSGDVAMSLEFHGTGTRVPDIYVEIGWKKATC